MMMVELRLCQILSLFEAGIEIEDVHEQRPLPREMIRRVPEKQHPQNGPRKRDTRDIRLRRRILIRVRVYRLEHGVYWTNDLFMSVSIQTTPASSRIDDAKRINFTDIVEEAIREQSRTASNHRPQPLPSSLLRRRDAASARGVEGALDSGVGAVRLDFLGHDGDGVA